MNTLGGIEIPDGAIWRDQRQWSPVAQESAATIGGGTVTWSVGVASGRPITLDLNQEFAWADETTANALQQLADAPDAIYGLVWEGRTYAVRFRHQESPALSLESLFQGSDFFVGQIKLIEV